MVPVETQPDRTATLVEAVLSTARDLLHADVAYVGRFDGPVQTFPWRVGDAERFGLTAEAEVALEDTYCQRVLDGRIPGVIPDTAAEPGVRDLPATRDCGIGAYVGLPLRASDGHVFGSLCALRGEVATGFDEGALAHLRALADLVADHLELRDQALRDPLTGLRNRRGLEEALRRELGRVERHARPATLLYLDLDGFKAINDTQGHAAGDDLLRSVGEALSETCRVSDEGARIGGDEFALLLAETGPSAGQAVARRLLEHVREATGGVVTASVGVAGPEPDPLAWMMAADSAMYEAKRAGGGRCVWAGESHSAA